MRRAIAWRDPYFVDWFHVRCPARRRIDWLLHVHGTLRELRGATLNDRSPVTLPRGPGWRHIERRRSVSTDGDGGPVAMHWSVRGGVLQVLLPDEQGTALTVGVAPSNPASEQMHSLIRTRYARATTFVAVIHPCARPGRLAAAVHGHAPDTVTLEVVVEGRTDRWRLAAAARGRAPALVPLP